jgi:hypothetical protein
MPPIFDSFPPPPEKTVTAAPVDGAPMRVCTHAESDDDTQACAWCGRASGPGHGKEHGGKKT